VAQVMQRLRRLWGRARASRRAKGARRRRLHRRRRRPSTSRGSS
jgi:hypothetical protein